MKSYDVIIVGGGPAGLHCARSLAQTDLSVLLLEKDPAFGDKVCAGGITKKDIDILGLPDEIIEHKVQKTMIASGNRISSADSPAPFVFTVNRRELGTWQRLQLEGTQVEVMSNARVTRVKDHEVEVKLSYNQQTSSFSFRFLVGADGYNSIVRRFLKLPVERRLIGIQYQIPLNGQDPKFEMHLHSKYFHSWYGWIFPHRETLAVGCLCDPKILPAKKLKQNFHQWLKEQQISTSGATYESAPISYDYRGIRFGNVFLIGDAGGFASGLTGEGIYQALVSARVAAGMITDEHYQSEELESVIRYNETQRRIMNIFIKAGFLRGTVHNLLIMALQRRMVKSKIHKGFAK